MVEKIHRIMMRLRLRLLTADFGMKKPVSTPIKQQNGARRPSLRPTKAMDETKYVNERRYEALTRPGLAGVIAGYSGRRGTASLRATSRRVRAGVEHPLSPED